MGHYLKTIKTIFEIAPDRRFQVMQLFLSNILYNMTSLLPPIATAGIIGVITDSNPSSIAAVWGYAGLYVVFYVVQYACLTWNYRVYTVISTYYYNTIQQHLFDHVANHDSILDHISRGKITDTCSEDVSYMVYAVDAASDAFSGILQLIVILFIFAGYNIIVAIAAMLIDLLYMYIMSRNSKYISKHYEGTRKYQDKIIDILNQMLGSLRQVKSLNLMPNLTKKLQKNRQQYQIQYVKKYRYTTARYCYIPMIVYLGKIGLYIILAYMVINKTITVDTLVLLISYFELVMTRTDDILEKLLNLDTYTVRLNRIKSILDYNSKTQVDYDGDIENDYINGVVVFDHVNFSMDDRQILNNVSFRASPNEITAIVGHPGAGKTTIINLLYRLYHVKSGSILIDDESIYNYSKKVYSSNVSGVFQKSFVFKMSIRDNLSLIDSNLNHQIEALKRVGLYDVVQRLPYGINTVIDSNESVLTYGQLQKLAIARALLSRAEILLFDEVTSSIDPASAADIIDILKDLKEDHTIIIITHKPEIMSLADKIIVMKDGRIVAKGKNKDVFERSALYRELRTAIFAQPSVNDDYINSDTRGYNDAPDLEEIK